MTKVTIIRVDPYHKAYGLAVPGIVQKFSDALTQFGDEDNMVASQFFPRLFAKDPSVLLLAAIDPTGAVKGFTAAMVANNECVMLQPRLDHQTENDAVKEMVDTVKEWALSMKFTELTMITRRVDPKWLKKHGFDITRYIATAQLTEE